jgi:RHS repeat-associated protein
MSEGFTNSACRGLSWTYDPWGNRTAQNVTAGTCGTSAVTVNNKNQLVGPPFQYDAAGNMINDGNHSYTYDAENRLISVDGGSTASYTYDALGRRVERVVGTTWTDYVYDLSANVVSEVNNVCASICWAAFYANLNGQLIAEYKNGTTYFVHQDHLGSTRLLTDVTKAIAQNLDYLPFGENNSADSHTSTHEFTGDERDAETSLDHTQFRQYTAQLARWITPDPAGLAAVDPTNPQSWNRYAYVLDNPLNLIDPLGLFTNCGNFITCVIAFPSGNPGGGGFGGGGTVGGPDGGATGGHNCLKSTSIDPGTGTPSQSNCGGGSSTSTSVTPKPNQGCVVPTTFQKFGISLQATAAKFWNTTIGLGLGGSAGGGVGIGTSAGYSQQLVVSPNGQAAFVTTSSDPAALPFNALVSPGAGGYGGFQFSFSNAKTPQDLAGEGIDVGAGAGAGPGVGGDLSLGNGTQGQIVGQLTVTAGGGAGGYGHGLSPIITTVKPICGQW